MKRTVWTIAVLTLCLPMAVIGQDPPATQDPPAAGGRGGGRAQEPQIRPYERVITKEAKTDDGVFTVHRIGDPCSTRSRKTSWVASSCG